MSFILNDEQLFINLVNSLVKKAQVPADKSIVDIAKKLVSKLERQYYDTPEPLNVSSATAVGLDVPNLQNIGKFLQFLTTNQIKLDGTRIAYNEGDPESKNLDESAKGFIAANVSRDPVTRGFEPGNFAVNIALLTKYISYLQDKASSLEKSGDDQGKVLRIMIGKLIDSLNQQIKTDLTRSQPKSSPENPSELAGDTVIDGFNRKLLDTKNPNGDTGSIPLKAKDLKTKEALMSWLKSFGGGSAWVAEYDDKGQRTERAFIEPGVNQCAAVNALEMRAEHLWKNEATSPQEKKLYTYYLRMTRELVPQFYGPDGKSCSISSSQQAAKKPGTGQGAGIGTGQGAGTGGGAGAGAGAGVDDSATLSEAVSTLPFAPGDINFERINFFFASLMKLTISTQITGKVSAVQNNMKNFNDNYMEGGESIISLGLNVGQYANMLKSNKNANQQIIPSLELLKRIIDGTAVIVQAFSNKYLHILDSTKASLVLGQVGRYETDNSIYKRNSYAIDHLINSVDTSAHPVK